MDHVIAEARKNGIRLMLSLVNNLNAFGGKTQYVKWAEKEGVALSSSNDSFFYDPTIRRYFKHYVKVIFLGKNFLQEKLVYCATSVFLKYNVVLLVRQRAREYALDPIKFGSSLGQIARSTARLFLKCRKVYLIEALSK